MMTTYDPTKTSRTYLPSLPYIGSSLAIICVSSKLQNYDYVFQDKQEPMQEAKTQLRKLKATQLLVHAREILHRPP